MNELSVIERTQAILRTLGAARGPIIVGPFLSEVGFELLYWIPFLRWAIALGALRREDLWVVSRGGCRSWYADLADHYVDVLDFYSPAAFRRANEARIAGQAERAVTLGMRKGHRSPKQQDVSTLDEDILTQVAQRESLEGYRLLHPSLMYQYFRPFWRRRAPRLYARSTQVRRLSVPARLADLPSSYVAMKFYQSSALPDAPITRRFIAEIVRMQAQASDVVLLDGAPVDDHAAFPMGAHPRIHRVPVSPETNLETQTAIVAHADRFVGTYGGFAYLAPFLGVPTIALYAHGNFRRDHRDVMTSLAKADLKVPFVVDELSLGRALVGRPIGGRRAA